MLPYSRWEDLGNAEHVVDSAYDNPDFFLDGDRKELKDEKFICKPDAPYRFI